MESRDFAEQMFQAFVPQPTKPTGRRFETVQVLRIEYIRVHRTKENGYHTQVFLPEFVISAVQYAMDNKKDPTDGLLWFIKAQEIYPDWGPKTVIPLFEETERGSLPIVDMAAQWGDEFIVEFADESVNPDDSAYNTFTHQYRYGNEGFHRLINGTQWVKVD